MPSGGACCIKRFLFAATAFLSIVWSTPILFPSPLVIETQEAGGTIYFSANRSILLSSGDCVTLRWAVDQIQAVHINEQAQTGSGEEHFCLTTDTLPTLRVIFRDGSEQTYRLNITILLSHPTTAILLALIVLTAAFNLRNLLSHPGWIAVLAAVIYLFFAKLVPLSELVATANWREASTALASILSVYTLLAFLLLTGLIYPHSESAVVAPNCLLWGWAIGAGIILILIIGTILYINPRGMYFANIFRPHQLLLRESKTAGYSNLSSTPDVVIMGSSRAFTMSPVSIQQKTGYTAYNMAIEGGRIEDVLIQARQMTGLPRILLIEVQEGLPREPNDIAARAPLGWLSYMSLDTSLLTVEKRLTGLIDLSHLTESLYIWRYHEWVERQPQEWPLFESDGLAIRPTISASALEQAILLDIGNIPPVQCGRVDETSQIDMATLIDLATVQDTRLVFYLSPRHPLYTTEILDNDPHYQTCYAAFTAYMDNLTRQHDDVFYVDASRLDLDTSESGFYDSQHLTQANSDRLIDALVDTLHTAGM